MHLMQNVPHTCPSYKFYIYVLHTKRTTYTSVYQIHFSHLMQTYHITIPHNKCTTCMSVIQNVPHTITKLGTYVFNTYMFLIQNSTHIEVLDIQTGHKKSWSWSAISFVNSKLFCMRNVCVEHVCSIFKMRNRKSVPHRRLTTYLSLIQNVPHACSSWNLSHTHTSY